MINNILARHCLNASFTVPNVPFDEGEMLIVLEMRQVLALTRCEIVEHSHLVTILEKRVCQV